MKKKGLQPTSQKYKGSLKNTKNSYMPTNCKIKKK